MKIVSHSGGDTGFRSYLLLVPEKNISVMLACNYELARTEDIGFAVLALLSGNKPEEIKRQIGFTFAEKLKKEGLDKARDFYYKTKEDSTATKNYIWEEDEGAFAYPGYLLMEQTMYKEAIEVFKFNLEQFPSSAWAHAHLGIGYARAKEKKLAKQNLLKAIELNPDEPYFKEELKKTGN